ANTDLVTGIASDRRLRGDIQQRIKQAEPNGWLLDIRIPDLGPMTDLTSLSQIEQLETAIFLPLDGLLAMDHLLARRGDGQYTARFHHSGDGLEDWLLQLRQTLEQESFACNGQSFRLRLLLGCVALDGQLQDAAQYISAAAQVSVQARNQPQRLEIGRAHV